MKSNSKKSKGFGLVEVIISMAIIAIISASIYTGYILAIKNTKSGQVKQAATLEGKKIIEEIKSSDVEMPGASSSNFSINGDITLTKQETDGVYLRFLNSNFEATNENSAKYIEKLTIVPTKASINNNEGNINYQYDEIKNPYEINISNELQNTSVISSINGEVIPELDSQKEILLSLYVEDGGKISIKDYKGSSVDLPVEIATVDDGKLNVVINFSEYKKRGNVSLKGVNINVYNKITSGTLNVYVQKSKEVESNIKIFKGTMNLYDNRADNQQEANIGTLYNIKVELMEYTQYLEDQKNKTHDDRNNLFTTDYNQNFDK